VPDEYIAAVSDSTPAAVAAAYLANRPAHTPPASPSEVALLEGQAKARESIEQLAQHGDGVAIAKLAQQHPPHAPGAPEPGKGQLIDEYD
jgi:hypothetical protein